MKKRNIIAVFSALVGLALLPIAQAAPGPETPDPASTCAFCTADGANALANASAGGGAANSAFGWWALFGNADASFNTAVGAGSLLSNNGANNSAVGAATLLFNTTGFNNTAVGTAALENNTEAVDNTALGAFALFTENATGGFPNGVSNNAIGRTALFNNTSGSFNQAMGVNALASNTTGSGNIAIGDDAMITNVDGFANTAVGSGAMFNNVSAELNTVVGSGAGANITTLGGNIYIGAGAGGATNEIGFIRIGTPTILGVSYDTYIAGIFGRGVDSGTAALVFADGNQKVGTVLVDANGNSVPFKPQAMLNESLKQQTKIAELEATIERQQKGMEVLTAQLNEQAAQIQKVSAQLEVNKPAPQIVANKP